MTITTDKIIYRRGLKYQLVEEAITKLSFHPLKEIHTPFISFLMDGSLINREGYAWDGASGPAIDDDSNMRPSLIHDSGYQLMRMGLLPQSYRELFDTEYHQLCLDRGMNPIRAAIEYEAIRICGGTYAKRQTEKLGCSP